MAEIANDLEVIEAAGDEPVLQGPATMACFLRSESAQGGDLMTRHHR